MSKLSQKTQERYGRKLYASNPSVPQSGAITKTKRARIGDEMQGIVVDNGTGEILGQGGAMVYKWEEVDKTRFVKLYLAGLKQAVGLSKAGMAVFEMVYDQVREHAGIDYVLLSAAASNMTTSTYNRGLAELIKRGFLFDSEIPSKYWVNIQYMFNGDRLAFVKGYKLKGADPRQVELPLDETPQITAE